MPFDAAAGRQRLIAIIKDRSFQTGPEMKLASGRTSSFYFNMKPTMLHAEGANLIANLILDQIADLTLMPGPSFEQSLPIAGLGQLGLQAARSFGDLGRRQT